MEPDQTAPRVTAVPRSWIACWIAAIWWSLNLQPNEPAVLNLKIDSSVANEVVVNDVEMPTNYISELVTQASEVVENYKTSFSDIVKFNQLVGFTSQDGLRLKANDSISSIEENTKSASNANLFTSIAKPPPVTKPSQNQS